MHLLLVRCRCPHCNLNYVRQIPDWQHLNYQLVYKIIENAILVPCDQCRKAEMKRLFDKI